MGICGSDGEQRKPLTRLDFSATWRKVAKRLWDLAAPQQQDKNDDDDDNDKCVFAVCVCVCVCMCVCVCACVCVAPIASHRSTSVGAVRSASGLASQIKDVTAAASCPAAERLQMNYTLPPFTRPLRLHRHSAVLRRTPPLRRFGVLGSNSCELGAAPGRGGGGDVWRSAAVQPRLPMNHG